MFLFQESLRPLQQTMEANGMVQPLLSVADLQTPENTPQASPRAPAPDEQPDHKPIPGAPKKRQPVIDRLYLEPVETPLPTRAKRNLFESAFNATAATTTAASNDVHGANSEGTHGEYVQFISTLVRGLQM